MTRLSTRRVSLDLVGRDWVLFSRNPLPYLCAKPLHIDDDSDRNRKIRYFFYNDLRNKDICGMPKVEMYRYQNFNRYR